MTTGLSEGDAVALLRSAAIFHGLSDSQLSEILSATQLHDLTRGEVLVRQGEKSNSIYVVVSGRFEVWIESHGSAVSEIGAGEPIGEIGFFAGIARTATIIAARDSKVIELNRVEFDNIARQTPAIQSTLLQTLGRRLAANNARLTSEQRAKPARTAVVIAGGRQKPLQDFCYSLARVVARGGKSRLLSRNDLELLFPGRTPDDPGVTDWLNTIEREYELIVYIADDALSDWTRKAIRQADQVLIVVSGIAVEPLNESEAFAFATHPPSRRRLVLVHERRSGSAPGTAGWLGSRDVALHHHVSIEDDADLTGLLRFLTGRAIGYVAAGGGGFGPAHIGVYKAFAERGVTFDILGGTSVGAAILGGFALLMSPEEIDRRIHDVFVTSRGFKHLTFPRYALLDHIPFDDALRRQFEDVCIEDAWRPYFALATVLDESGEGAYLLRRGPIWKAVRASGSLPAVLPPVLTDDGRMLVDGAVIDNIPLRPMKSLKAGPNVIVHFGTRGVPQRFDTDYARIPGRWGLMRQMLTREGRRQLPDLPNPVGVLQRCLAMHQTVESLPLGPRDLVLTVPAFPGANFMDFDRHTEVFHAAYEWARSQLDLLTNNGNPALAEILAAHVE